MSALSISTGPIATITLNRPEVRNAFNDEVIAELTQAFAQFGAPSCWPPRVRPFAPVQI